MQRTAVLTAFCAAVIVTSCTGGILHPAPTEPAAVSVPTGTGAPASGLVPASAQVYRESGAASWYGPADREVLSAAHRTLPIGTIIRVTNLDNYRSIDVPVGDRGPFVRGRVLDLSFGAARALDFVREGTARVKIETIDPVRIEGPFSVQAASFTEEEMARTLKARLQTKYETVYIVPGGTGNGRTYRVRVGLYPTEEKAERIAAKLTFDGLEPVVVKKD